MGCRAASAGWSFAGPCSGEHRIPTAVLGHQWNDHRTLPGSGCAVCTGFSPSSWCPQAAALPQQLCIREHPAEVRETTRGLTLNTFLDFARSRSKFLHKSHWVSAMLHCAFIACTSFDCFDSYLVACCWHSGRACLTNKSDSLYCCAIKQLSGVCSATGFRQLIVGLDQRAWIQILTLSSSRCAATNKLLNVSHPAYCLPFFLQK